MTTLNELRRKWNNHEPFTQNDSQWMYEIMEDVHRLCQKMQAEYDRGECVKCNEGTSHGNTNKSGNVKKICTVCNILKGEAQ